MKPKNLVKGLAIIMLACLTTGCGVFRISLKNDSAKDSQKRPLHHPSRHPKRQNPKKTQKTA